MTSTRLLIGLAGVIGLVASASSVSVTVHGEQDEADGPQFADGSRLVRPTDYRKWMFLSSGLSMTYEDEGDGSETGLRLFQNVFVNPSSYRHFMETGTWKDGTTFVLEFRRAATEGSINQAGRFQTDLVMMEAEVKDSRFPDGWAYYNFGTADQLADAAEPLSGARAERCVECHTEHTAVERTFVQFYPTLLDVAREKGTLKPGF